MTRGNQRELARQKAAKKSTKKTGSDHEGNKGMKLNDRKQRDADAMRLKQQKAEEKKAAGATGEKK